MATINAHYTVTNKNNALNAWSFTNATYLTITIDSVILAPGEVIDKASFAVTIPNGTFNIVSKGYTAGVSHDFGLIQDGWLMGGGVGANYIRIWADVRLTNGNYVTQLFTPVVYQYTQLSYSRFNVYRDEIDVEKAIYDAAFSTSPISINSINRNSLTYKRQYYDLVWTDMDVSPVNVPSFEFDGQNEHTLPYIENVTYQTRIVIEDVFNQLIISDILPTAAVPFSVGIDGVGAGKIHEQGALDIQGEVFRNGVSQPKIFRKKPSDPDPEGMEDGDILIIYNETEPFISLNFPQEFGTSYTWSQIGTWPTDFNYWTSTAATTNTIVESIEASSFKGSNYPYLIFDNDFYYSNGIYMPYGTLPGIQIIKFKGSVQFNSFQLTGWAQGHEIKNSPKSFAFFGSNDAHTWVSLYDTTSFPDTYNTTSASTTMTNSGLFFKYLKLVWRTNQDDNSGNVTNATMIAVRELTFNASGYRYV